MMNLTYLLRRASSTVHARLFPYLTTFSPSRVHDAGVMHACTMRLAQHEALSSVVGSQLVTMPGHIKPKPREKSIAAKLD